jgi:HEAT repeat protein
VQNILSTYLAIELLGDSGVPSALAALRERLATERDPRVVVEIARATARIGGEQAMMILSGLKSHRSTLVREAVSDFCEEAVDEGCRRVTVAGLSPLNDWLDC